MLTGVVSALSENHWKLSKVFCESLIIMLVSKISKFGKLPLQTAVSLFNVKLILGQPAQSKMVLATSLKQAVGLS